jgi:hypothetical protein
MIITVTFLDGQLGFLAPAPRSVVTIGAAVSGTVNQLTPITDKQTLTTTFSGGDLVESDAFQLANGSGVAYALRINTSTPGTASAVTANTQAGSDGVLALTGTPTLSYRQVIVQVTAAGIVAGPNTPTVIISWDGGITFSAPITVPIGGVYTPVDPPSGLTFHFTNGAGGFKVGDTFTFSAVGPAWSNTDLTNALDALRGDPTSDWEFFHVVGPSSPSAFAVVISEINLMRQDGRFVWAMIEARDFNTGETELQWMNAIKSDFTNSVASQGQIVIVAGYGYQTSAVSGDVFWRSLAQPVAALTTNTLFYSQNLGETDVGPLPGLLPGPDGKTVVSHDERKVPGLAAARFLAIATVIGQKGYFVGDNATYEPATFAAPLSDYSKVHFMRVAMRTANLAVQIGSSQLGKRVEVNRNGTINDRFAREKELYIQNLLKIQLVPGELIDIDVQISRTVNLKSTGKLPIKIIMDSYAYINEIDFTIGFLNPNLVTVTA